MDLTHAPSDGANDSDPLGQWVDPRTGEVLSQDASGTAIPLAVAHHIARESGAGGGWPDAGGLSLDLATHTVSPTPKPSHFRGSHVLSVYETCGEATVHWQKASPEESAASALPKTGVRGSGSGRALVEGNRRARREVRRYCVHNQLTKLWTLTYATEHLPDDWEGVWKDLDRFRRRLYELLGKKVPVVLVVERGEDPDGTQRLHVHMAAESIYIDHAAMAAVWGRGHVHYRDRLAGRSKRHRGKRSQARAVASYLSSYLTKQDSTSAGREFNGKRYSKTTGFGARKRKLFVPSPTAGLNVARSLCGGSVEWEFHSDDDPDWLGMPVHCYRFGDP